MFHSKGGGGGETGLPWAGRGNGTLSVHGRALSNAESGVAKEVLAEGLRLALWFRGMAEKFDSLEEHLEKFVENIRQLGIIVSDFQPSSQAGLSQKLWASSLLPSHSGFPNLFSKAGVIPLGIVGNSQWEYGVLFKIESHSFTCHWIENIIILNILAAELPVVCVFGGGEA